MIRITEKLGFGRTRAVAVCAKVGIGRKVGHKKRVFLQICDKTASKTKSLTVQGDFDKIIDVERTELCFVSV